jgi:hypothetical protein
MTNGQPNSTSQDARDDVAAAQRRRALINARVHDYRRRKRDGLRLVPLEIFEGELDVLVEHGLLLPIKRNDYRVAVPEALEKLIEAAVAALIEGRLCP